MAGSARGRQSEPGPAAGSGNSCGRSPQAGPTVASHAGRLPHDHAVCCGLLRKGIFDGLHGRSPSQDDADLFDRLDGQFGDIDQGGLFDFTVAAPSALSNEDTGRAVLVWNSCNIYGNDIRY